MLFLYGPRVEPEDRAVLERLLSACGRTVVVTEPQGRTCADLTSCGPAFIAYILREMSRAAAAFRPDLDQATCDTLVKETALATARLLLEADLSFDDIIQRVAVPGGITAEGLQVLAEGVPSAFAHLFTITHEVEQLKKGQVPL